MNHSRLILLALLLITLIAGLRLLWNARHARLAGAAYPRPWRTATLVVLQLATGTALYLTLLPPERSVQVPELLVYAGNSKSTALPNAIALPEAPSAIDAKRVADLASALRQHPGTHRIQVLGDGLLPRDQDAAHDLALRFVPSPQPPGVVDLELPYWVTAGQSWQLRGTASGVAGGTVALIDPSGVTVARAAVTPDGQFEMRANSRSVGRALFTLSVMDEAQKPLQQLTVPLATVPGDSLRVAIIAGSVNPELKYLRRWAIDAGLRLGSRMMMSPNSDVVDQPVELSLAALAEWDLLLLDDRAWYGLRERERDAVQEAVRAGLGLLLRLTSEPSARERGLLAPLGFSIDSAAISRGVRLPPSAAPDSGQPSQSTDNARNPELSRRSLRIAGADAQALLRNANDEPLATWRPFGRGRVALWWLTDSYRLVLAGQGPRHADVWSHALETLARARGDTVPRFHERHAWVGQRLVVCAVGDMRVVAPDASALVLVPDPASDSGCAGYWPQQGGWHVLDIFGKQWPFYVRTADQDSGLRNAQVRADTAQLASDTHDSSDAITTPQPIPRWQPLLLWLLIAAPLWVLERSRLGMVRD